MNRAFAFFILLIFFTLSVAPLAEATNVSGTITTDSTWDISGSPYVLTGNVTIVDTASLSIDAGVEVQFSSSRMISVRGYLSADNATFIGSGTIAFVSPGNGSLSGCGISGPRVSVTETSPDITSCTISGNGITISGTEAHPSIVGCNFPSGGQPMSISAGVNGVAVSGCTFGSNARVGLSGTVTSDWTLPSLQRLPYYLTENLNVNAGVTLTISSADVDTVYFGWHSVQSGYSTYYYPHNLNVNGTLQAAGVCFTGTGHEPGIGFTSTSNGSVTGCTFRSASVRITDSSPDVVGCGIISTASAIVINGVAAHPTVTNCTFTSVTYPFSIGIGVTDVAVSGCTFEDGDRAALSGTVTSDWTLPSLQRLSYYLLGDLTVASGATLTISSTNVDSVFFGWYRTGSSPYYHYYPYNLNVDGTLHAAGVSFRETSYDPAIAYRTNSIGYLAGCSLYGVSIHVGNSSPIIQGCTISNSSASIVINSDNASPTIEYCSLWGSGTGISCSAGDCFIDACQLTGKTTGIDISALGDATVTNCNLQQNNVALSNSSINQVSAENCYWGSTNGPYHATVNPSGSGNPVTGDVDFFPYRTTPYDRGMIAGLALQNQFNTPAIGAYVEVDPGNYVDPYGTDNVGLFVVKNIPGGTGYELTVTIPGYSSRTVGGIQVNPTSCTWITVVVDGIPSDAYRIVNLRPDPNPAISTIEEGGTLSRFYKIVDNVSQLGRYGVPIHVSSDDEQYTFVSNASGIVQVSIPSVDIGDGVPDEVEMFTIDQLAGEPLAPDEQTYFTCRVESREFAKEWTSENTIKLGHAFVRVQLERGSVVRLKEDTDNGVTGDALEVVRQRFTGAGVGADFSVGAQLESSIANAGAHAGGGAEVIISRLTEDEYRFPYPDPSDWQASAEYILFADGNMNGLDEPMVRFFGLLEDWFTENHTMDDVYKSDATGFDIGGNVYAEGQIGFEVAEEMNIGASGEISGDGHLTFLIRNDEQTGLRTLESGVTGEINGGIGAGLRFGSAYGSPATSGLAADLGIFQNGSWLWGAGLRYSYNPGNGEWTSLEYEHVKKSTGSETGTEYTTTYSIANPVLQQTLASASNVPLVGPQSQLFQNGGTSILGNSSCDLAFHNGFEQIYDQQTQDTSAHVMITRKRRDIEESPSFSLEIHASELANVHVEADFHEAISRVDKRGEYVKGASYYTENYDDSPNIAVEYGALLQDVIDQTPLSVRIAAFVSNLISFLFREGEQSFPLGEGGSYAYLGPNAMPAGTDSVYCNSWGWYGASSLVTGASLPAQKRQIYQNIRNEREEAAGMRYGIGGFYQFEPYGTTWQDTVLLTIHYLDAEIDGFDESELTMYVEDKRNIDWIYIGGVLNPDSNTVTARIESLGCYTLAPRLPRGRFGLTPSAPSMSADDSSRILFTSTTIYNNDSTVISDGREFDITADAGTLIANDVDSVRDGLQVESTGGTISFELQSGPISYVCRVQANSIAGTAEADTTVLFTDAIPPTPPDSIFLFAQNGSVEVRWTAAPDNDIEGYRVYFDMDSLPPFDGIATVYGTNSPIEVGNVFGRLVTGLWNDSLYYFTVTAVDISGNESNYSPVATAIPIRPAIINLVISTVGTDNLLWWSPVAGANDYDVYFATESYEDIQQYDLVGTTYEPFFRHVDGNATEEKGFYRVVAR